MPPTVRPRPTPLASPTLLAVARAAGVSRTTASNAFNRPDQLSAEVRARVLAAAARLGYAGPHAAARMLRRGRAGAVGVVFDESLPYAFGDPAAVAFLRGVATGCEAAGVGLVLLPRLGAEAAGRLVREAAVDGFLVCSTPDDSPLIEAVVARRLPFVTVDQTPRPGAPAVDVDDRGGARAAAAHLLGLGHRRLAVLAMELRPDGYEGPVTPERRAAATYATARLRLAGYADALVAAGLDPAALPADERLNREAGGRDGALALLACRPRPTALLAMSDRLALGALEAARALGLAVPGDLSVVGFDDVPEAARAVPPLTTVRQPLERKGAKAAAALLRLAGHGAPAEAPAEPAAAALPTELVVRASTAAPPAADSRA